jgi:hypothetical protein
MTIDERVAAETGELAERIERAAAEVEAERTKVRAAAQPLFDELRSANLKGDLSLMAKIYKRIAARFSEAGCHGDAQTYRLDAANCTATLRRSNWVANRKGERR